MYPVDQPNAVNRVVHAARDLFKMLRGHGEPSVTSKGTVDGISLADELRALREEIDRFLAS